MELLITLILIISILSTFGALLALPLYLPALTQLARTTRLRRRLLLGISGLFTFIVCLVGVSYMDAIVTKALSTNSLDSYPAFVLDSEQDALLTRELWLQNIVMPSVRADCYTHDIAVCSVSHSIEANLHMDTTTEYFILLAHAFIAVMGNLMMANYILRDNRKKKAPILITG